MQLIVQLFCRKIIFAFNKIYNDFHYSLNFILRSIDGIEEWGEATEDVSKVQLEEQELERVNLENYSSGRPKRLTRTPVRYLA